MAFSSFLSLSFCLLVFLHGCFAQIEPVTTHPRGFPPIQRRQRPQRDECQLDRISAVEPHRRIQSEAGVTDVWDENDDQFQCAGVVAMRHIIREKGLLLPQYVNGPKLIYVVQGRGVQGVVFPGCPETYQSSESRPQPQPRYGGFGQSGRESMRDHHQKVRQIREGDVIAVPTGVTQWVYNNGRTPLVLVQVVDTNNPANQLDQNHRVFFVAGNPQLDVQSKKGESQRGERSERGLTRKPAERDTAGNVFSGMDERVLAEAFNVNTDVARRLRGEDDYRGMIVTVERGLEVLTPQRSPEEERQIKEEEQQKQFELGPSRGTGGYNGIEETLCTAKLRHNVNDPSDTDIFNPRAGRITTVNSHVIPILRNLQFTVQKGVLYRNAIYAPHWNVNAHSVNYVVRGNGHVQMVDDSGNTVFDGQVQEGQMFVAPQNFVVVKKASEQGMEWVSFKTNDAAKVSQLAGRVSAIRSMPVEVLANAFQVSIEEAMRIKENRQEVTLLSPRTRSRFNVTEGSE